MIDTCCCFGTFDLLSTMSQIELVGNERGMEIDQEKWNYSHQMNNEVISGPLFQQFTVTQDIVEQEQTAEDHLLKQFVQDHKVTSKQQPPHPKASKTHECNRCKKVFPSASKLTEHYRTHTGEKPFVCDLCNKPFARKGDMKCHRLLHTGVKSYNCDLCDYTSDRKDVMRSHRLTHIGVCDKTLARSDDMQLHSLRHASEKRYRCDLCGEVSINKYHMISHSLTHTGENHDRCDLVDKTFAQKSKMESHRLNHSEKSFGCDLDNKYKNTDKTVTTVNMEVAKENCLIFFEPMRNLHENEGYCEVNYSHNVLNTVSDKSMNSEAKSYDEMLNYSSGCQTSPAIPDALLDLNADNDLYEVVELQMQHQRLEEEEFLNFLP